MVTYKYLEVRRDVYDKCSNKGMNQYRTIKQIQGLWKRSYWVLFIGMVICIITAIVLMFLLPNSPWIVVPGIVGGIITFITELGGEKLYNPKERKRELDQKKQNYEEYVQQIRSVMTENGITSKELREKLRKECTNQLELHMRPFDSMNSRISNMLIGVPLGALVSALIYKNDDAVIEQIWGIVIIGVMIVGGITLIKKIKYYTEGYFKDQHLLQVLNEVEYFEKE